MGRAMGKAYRASEAAQASKPSETTHEREHGSRAVTGGESMAEGLVITDHLNQLVGGSPNGENAFSSSPCLQSAGRDGRTLASFPVKHEGDKQREDGAPARRV